MKFPKPDKRGINKLIEAVRAAPIERHIMGCWQTEVTVDQKNNPVDFSARFQMDGSLREDLKCDTAACVGGWATLVTPKAKRATFDPYGDHHVKNLKHLVDPRGTGKLRTAIGAITSGEDYPTRGKKNSSNFYGISQGKFDEGPARKRKTAMIKVLETFRDTGEIRWSKAAPWAVPKET